MSEPESYWITSSDDFLALREEWNELLSDSACDCLFLTWEWQFSWWQHLAERRTLAILIIRREEQLIAIAPMAIKPPDIKRMVPFCVLEIMGAGNVGSDYLSIIVRNDSETSAVPAIMAELLERNFVLELGNTERTSRVMTMSALSLNDLGCRIGRTTQSFCPYIDLAGQSWKSYMTRNSKSGESRYNKKVRKLNKDFSLRFEQTSVESERAQDLAILIELHLKRWDGKGGSNAFDSEALCDFHRTFSSIALEKKWLRLFIMWLDDKPAAAVYGFLYKHVFYYYQAGFDPQFSQYSVGYLAIGLTMQKALAEGATEYDMLHGEEDYKYTWANGERELVRLSIFPPTLKGRFCEHFLELRNRTKELLVNHAPDSIRERFFASV